mgnify:CR=1 FL=1
MSGLGVSGGATQEFTFTILTNDKSKVKLLLFHGIHELSGGVVCCATRPDLQLTNILCGCKF